MNGLCKTCNTVERQNHMSRRWMRSWLLVWQALLVPALGLHTVFRTRRQSPEDDPVSTLQNRQPYSIPDRWFRQRFDHLRPDNRTWHQVIRV